MLQDEMLLAGVATKCMQYINPRPSRSCNRVSDSRSHYLSTDRHRLVSSTLVIQPLLIVVYKICDHVRLWPRLRPRGARYVPARRGRALRPLNGLPALAELNELTKFPLRNTKKSRSRSSMEMKHSTRQCSKSPRSHLHGRQSNYTVLVS
jgi:hypothetical protein